MASSYTSGPLYPVGGFDASALKNATLIIPSVSLGNVPQLAADLLVSSLQLTRVAFLGRGDTVAPFAGRGEGGIVTGGLELYGPKSGSGEVFVLLQRAPTLKAKKDAHVELISSLAQQCASTLLLTSLDAANQDDAQLLTPHQAIVPPTGVTASLTNLTQLPPLDLRLEFPQPGTQPTTYPPFLPGAGLTRRVLAALQPSNVGAIAAWVVEGDNRGDAHALAAVVLGVLAVQTEIKEPKDWEGLFGPGEGWSGGAGRDAEIYG